MKVLLAAVSFAAALIFISPASAKMTACTGENMAKSVGAASAMPDAPPKFAIMKEMGAVNTAMSKGDMRGACKSYMRAQKMGAK
ncbi:MAG TPA: hypothetical protein VKB08_13010 [Bradyrhizobium sp.]|jgi:hypothetical protein|nr:hypothetical protein [Bradyrhizobium sp.]